jgi:hypothetical protein
MATVERSTCDAFNSYLDGLRRCDIGFTLVQFNHGYDITCHDVPIEDAPALGSHNYDPCGGTHLYDTIVDMIHDAASRVSPTSRVVIVIQTDGQDAGSTKTEAYAKHLIELRRAAGWQFVFLGAGINPYPVADSLGIDRMSTLGYAHGRESSGFASLAANTASFARGYTSDVSFDEDEKTDAGDRYITNQQQRSLRA